MIASLVAAFVLGIVFGACASRIPYRSLAGRRVPPDSGPPSDFLADPVLPVLPEARPIAGDSVPGDGTATAAPGYPIEGNGRSGIYHLPGGFAYARTVPTICFRTPEAAEAAGLRASKS